MNTQALILMTSSFVIITAVTVYFFYKVLVTPHKPEPDSYSENDDEN